MKKWLLVLGANSDIAMATAHQFAQQGWCLILASRDTPLLKRSAKDIQIRHQIEALALEFDALDFKSHASFYENLPQKIDAVFLAFGYLGDQTQAQQDFTVAQKIISTNYTAVVSIVEIIATDFIQRQTGHIMVVSSVAGDRGRASNYIYGSAKAGLSAYLEGLRHRLFSLGIPVMTIKPGFVATKMTHGLDLPQKLLAQPQQVAKAVYGGFLKKRDVIYTKGIWRFIMLIIIHLPRFLFKRTKL